MKTIKWQLINGVLWAVIFLSVGLLFDVRGILAVATFGVASMIVSLSITVFLMWLDYRR